jgi:hypothetical protein
LKFKKTNQPQSHSWQHNDHYSNSAVHKFTSMQVKKFCTVFVDNFVQNLLQSGQVLDFMRQNFAARKNSKIHRQCKS